MRLMALILFFIAVSGCQSGFFAYDLDTPNNSVKSVNESPVAQAMGALPEETSFQQLVVNDADFKQAASARSMLKSIENLQAHLPENILLEYLKNLTLFLVQMPSFQVDIDVIKKELSNVIKQLTTLAPRLDEIINPPTKKQALDKKLIQEHIASLRVSINTVSQAESTKEYIDALPVKELLKKLQEEKKLVPIKVKHPKDLMIYADYLKIKNYGVFIIDVAAVLAEASRINLSEEQAHEWLLGVIEREALKHVLPVAILSNSTQLNLENLGKINTHIILLSNLKDALSLPLSLMMALKIIDKAFSAAPDLAIIKDMFKIAKAIDGEAISVGLVDELCHKFLAQSTKFNPEQKKHLSKLLIKQTFNSSDELIDFIDSFSLAFVNQKLLEDSLWFYKNLRKDSLSFEQLLTRITWYRAELAIFDAEDAKEQARLAKIEADISSAQAAAALNDASLARETQQQQLASIDADKMQMQKFAIDKQNEINMLSSEFKKQLDKLITDIFSDIDVSTIKTVHDLENILDAKSKNIKNIPEIDVVKQLFNKEISKLDSRIANSKTVHEVMTHKVTQVVGNLLFKAAAGYLTGGTEGALKAAAKTATEIFTTELFKFLKG